MRKHSFVPMVRLHLLSSSGPYTNNGRTVHTYTMSVSCMDRIQTIDEQFIYIQWVFHVWNTTSKSHQYKNSYKRIILTNYYFYVTSTKTSTRTQYINEISVWRLSLIHISFTPWFINNTHLTTYAFLKNIMYPFCINGTFFSL